MADITCFLVLFFLWLTALCSRVFLVLLFLWLNDVSSRAFGASFLVAERHVLARFCCSFSCGWMPFRSRGFGAFFLVAERLVLLVFCDIMSRCGVTVLRHRCVMLLRYPVIWRPYASLSCDVVMWRSYGTLSCECYGTLSCDALMLPCHVTFLTMLRYHVVWRNFTSMIC